MEQKRKTRTWCGFLLLLVLLAVFLIWNLFAGSVQLSASQIGQILLGGRDDLTQQRIIMQIRLPRMASALILGGALSVSGYLLQTFFHNPIAGPFVLGISSGAKLAVSIAMIVFLSRGVRSSSALLIGAAFIGAMLSMGLILLISQRVNQMSLLVVCGVMIGYICSALTDFLVTFADDSNIVNLHNWSNGSFSGMKWENVTTMAWVCGIALILTFFLSKPIRAYQLGEVYARNMGVPIKAFRAALILLSSILSACVTACPGGSSARTLTGFPTPGNIPITIEIESIAVIHFFPHFLFMFSSSLSYINVILVSECCLCIQTSSYIIIISKYFLKRKKNRCIL